MYKIFITYKQRLRIFFGFHNWISIVHSAISVKSVRNFSVIILKSYFCAGFGSMKKSVLYLILGTAASFLFHNYVMSYGTWDVNLYYAFSFGLGWGLSYFVDRPEWKLSRKMGISFIGIAVLLVLGFLLYNFEIAVPSIIRFSTIFVVYYLFASFRADKSLRS